MSLADPATSDKLLEDAGFEVLRGAENAPDIFDLSDPDAAMKYCALPM